MSPSRVAEVLAEVFQTYGFDTCLDSEPQGASGTNYRVDVVAERAGIDTVVQIEDRPEPLDATHVRAHARLVRDLGHRYGVFVNLQGFTEEAHLTAADADIILWDRLALETLIGRAVLHEILDPTVEPPIAEILGVTGRAPFAASRTDLTSVDTVAAPDAGTNAPSPPTEAVSFAAPSEMFGFDPLALQPSSPEEEGTTSASAPDAHEPLLAATYDASPPSHSSDDPLRRMVADALDRGTHTDVTNGTGTRADATFRSSQGPSDGPTGATSTAHRSAEPQPADDGPHITQGSGWILETSRVVQPRPVDDPDPLPVQREAPLSERPSSYHGIARAASDTHVLRGAARPDPRTFNPESGALLAPTISKEQAARMAIQRIFTVDHTWLRYHPKRVMRWQVDAYVEGQIDTRTMRGVALVDTATREVRMLDDWEPSRNLREGTFDVAVDHKPIRIDADKVREIALRHVLDATAREVTMQDYDAGHDIVVTEKKRIRAHADDVRFDDEGLQWCPVWCFKGVNGAIEVDGLTGSVIEEQLSGPAAETIIL